MQVAAEHATGTRPAPLPARGRSALLDTALIVAFLLAIGVPAVMTALRPQTTSVRVELRQPARFPKPALAAHALRAFPSGFDAWFRDSFWPRSTLIRGHNAAKVLGLSVSPHPTLALGPNRWLFLNDPDYVACTRGTDPFSAAELDAWVDALAACDAWCRERDIDFLFLVAPNKATVYPEELPAGFERVGPTRMDVLLAALRERTQVEVLDLRPSLAAAKEVERDDLYYPLGTHWNGLGAEVAYRDVLRWVGRRHRGVVPVPRQRMLRTYNDRGDSWAPKLYLSDLLLQANPVVKHPRIGRVRRGPAPGVPASGQTSLLAEGRNPDAPRLFVLHDSFGGWLLDLLAPHFSTSIWMSSPDFAVDVVERAKPDVVIYERVERMLHFPPPNPAKQVQRGGR